MKRLQSDMGTYYKNELIAEFCKLLNVKQDISTAYHHHSLGSVERNHRVFNEYIRSFLESMSSWDDYLHYFTFLYNTSKNSCFGEKYSPYELVFGSNVNVLEFVENDIEPLYNAKNQEIKYKLQVSHERAKQLLEKLKHQNKVYYDKKLNSINVNIGDEIILKREPYMLYITNIKIYTLVHS